MEESYWKKRYLENEIGWNIGQISSPIQSYIDQLEDKNIRILIPGCGYGHEASYFYQKGFKHTFVLDFVTEATEQFKKLNPHFPANQIFNEDFFQHQGKYDLIIEQTLFCAINPLDREKYVQKIDELLNPYGKLVGVLFDFPLDDGPPFGGTKTQYQELFAKKFNSVSIEKCYNSIKPRENREFFIQIKK